MSIKSYQYTFGAGDTRQYIGGGFFTIEQVTDEITLNIKDPRGNSIGIVENIGAGFWINLDDKEIGSIDIYSATTQTINVIIGAGEFGVNKTSSTITGGKLDPNTLSSSYWNSNILSSVITILSPASNVNGVIVLSSWLSFVGFGQARIMAKTSAPTGVNDTSANTLCHLSAASTLLENASNTEPTFLPAGYGIYANKNTTNAGEFVVEYEIF